MCIINHWRSALISWQLLHVTLLVVSVVISGFDIFQHGGRLRERISDNLLGDLEPDDVQDSRLPPRV